MLHDSIESDDEALANFAFKTQNDQPLANGEISKNAQVFDSFEVSVSAQVLDPFAVFENAQVHDSLAVSVNDKISAETFEHAELFDPAGFYGNNGIQQPNSFTDSAPVMAKCHDVLMALRAPHLSEHSSYHGGAEKQFHRGANGHTRHITCKECGGNVIQGRRKEPLQLWSYLV